MTKALPATLGSLILAAGLGPAGSTSWGCAPPAQPGCTADTFPVRIVGLRVPAVVKAGSAATIEAEYLGAECQYRLLSVDVSPPVISVRAEITMRNQRGTCLDVEDCREPGVATASLPPLEPGSYTVRAAFKDFKDLQSQPTASITVEP